MWNYLFKELKRFYDVIGTSRKLFGKNICHYDILNPISSDLNVLRRSIFSNICLHLKRNQDRGYEDLGIFEVGPIFFGKQPGQQLTVAGGVKTGLIGRKSWIDKPRKLDVFDIKSDVFRTLFELNL